MSFIKKIRIKNFKNLEDVEIDIKPLTFLFGPNGSGKSSFIKAMMFLSKNLFPLNSLKTIYKISDEVDLGTFKEIVTNNDTSRNIVFEIDMEGEYLFPKKELLTLDDYTNGSLRSAEIYDDSFEYLRLEEILNKLNDYPFFTVIEELMEDIYINIDQGLEIKYEKLFNKNSLNFTFTVEFKYDETGVNLFTIKMKDNNSQSSFEASMEKSDVSGYSFISNEINLLNDKYLTEIFLKFFRNTFTDGYPSNFPNKLQFVNITNEDPFISNFNHYVTDETIDKWKNISKDKRLEIYFKLLKLIYINYRLVPNNLFRFFIYKHLPLTRITPKSKYNLEDNLFDDRDYYGLLNLLPRKQEAYNINLSKFFDLKLFIECNNEVGRIYIQKHATKINFSSASSGLIQLFPIIIYSELLTFNPYKFIINTNCDSAEKDTFDLVGRYDYTYKNQETYFFNNYFFQLLIEQPELHLHPKLQSQLAKLFADTIKKSKNENFLIIETHSEHLIRKIQVLIANGELDRDKVSVLYFDNKDGKPTEVEEMKIDEKGLFVKDWPDGFFDDSKNLALEMLEAMRKRNN